ncbi:MAG: DUF2232 domain-containing protein [Spirochaetales bacterium]|nr:DUF2232 domain-containing protein [Spirochaetales bacterium]
MSEAIERRAGTVPALVSGALSGVLYATLALSPAFLAPLQAARRRGGFRAFLIAGTIALAACAAVTVARFRSLAVPFGILDVLSGLLMPGSLVAALALVNVPALSGVHLAYRLLLGTGIATLGAMPALLPVVTGPESAAHLERMFSAVAEAMNGGAEGLERFDAAALAAAFRMAMTNGFVAGLLFILTADYWVGERFGRKAGEPRGDGLGSFKVPAGLLWPFLVAWAATLVTRVLETGAVEVVAWNGALPLSVLYGFQGLSLLGRLAARWIPRPLRFAAAFTLALLALSPATSLGVAIALPVLGLSENWIPYRTTKEITDEGHPEQ